VKFAVLNGRVVALLVRLLLAAARLGHKRRRSGRSLARRGGAVVRVQAAVCVDVVLLARSELPFGGSPGVLLTGGVVGILGILPA
jgi:hypothetical protein